MYDAQGDAQKEKDGAENRTKKSKFDLREKTATPERCYTEQHTVILVI